MDKLQIYIIESHLLDLIANLMTFNNDLTKLDMIRIIQTLLTKHEQGLIVVNSQYNINQKDIEKMVLGDQL